MRAIQYERYGGPELLHVAERAEPRVAAREVLVRVHAASVNAADWFMLTGRPWVVRLMTGLFRPSSQQLGLDLAGEVVEVGTGVTRVRPGDAVFGQARGTFAEYALVNEQHLARKPEQMSFVEAATLPVAGCTALQGLREQARVQAGDRVLVNGASGGVGSFVVEIARALGAEVTAVCSSRNLERARELGAAHVVDYSREDFSATGERYDALFDLVGSVPLSRCVRLLRPDGVYVSSVGRIGWVLKAAISSLVPRSRVRLLSSHATLADLETLADLVTQGLVRPRVDHTYGLDEVPLALRLQGLGHAQGKTVITLSREVEGVRPPPCADR